MIGGTRGHRRGSIVVVSGSVVVLLVVLSAPANVAAAPAPIEPVPLDLTPRPAPARPKVHLDARRGRRPAIDIVEQVFGPAPYPDIAEPEATDVVTVVVQPDGTAKATRPRAVRGVGAACVLDRCASTKGIRSLRRRPEAPTPGDANTPGTQRKTAPRLVGLAFAFGWQPPSSAAAAATLRETSDQRVAQAIASGKAALERSRRELGSRLSRILHDPELSARQKRRIVFELWDDAMLTASEPVSDRDALAHERARTAHSVAQAIERFVRRTMPRGSDLGYDARELAELDRARRGPQRFSPYSAD